MTDKGFLLITSFAEVLLIYLNVVVYDDPHLFIIVHDALVINGGFIGILLYKTIIKPRRKHVEGDAPSSSRGGGNQYMYSFWRRNPIDGVTGED